MLYKYMSNDIFIKIFISVHFMNVNKFNLLIINDTY